MELELGMIQMAEEEHTCVHVCVFVHTCTCACSALWVHMCVRACLYVSVCACVVRTCV